MGVLLSALFAGLAFAATSAEQLAAEQKARDYFTNLEVFDQDGKSLRFYDDVLKDKVVAINFIFTNCQGACPLMTRQMTMVRDMLGVDLGTRTPSFKLPLRAP